MDVIIGTAGHIDHGKTALVRTLTGTDTDRLPEEKQRGITIDLGFAELEMGDTHFGFVDVPGHDLDHSGPRANFAVRADASFPGGSTQAALGQTYRL